MDGLLPLAGAGLAVAGLVALCWALGFRGTPQLDGESEAIALAGAMPGGFSPARILLAADARHALLVDMTGRLVLVMPHGANFIARTLDSQVRTQAVDGLLDLTLPHRMVRIEVGEQLPAWLDLLKVRVAA